MIRAEYYTDKGYISAVNQDAIFSDSSGDVAVFCVADGMGGHMNGELASRAIVESVVSWYHDNAYDCVNMAFEQLLNNLEKALTNANRKIYEEYNSNGLCGSTVVVLVISKDKYAIFSAGDSRVYLKSGLGFSQLTVDDVWQNKPNILMNMGANDIKKNENYGKLTKAVGIKNHIVFNRITGIMKKRDIFFLCCDGVYKCIPDKKLGRIFGNSKKLCDEIKKAGAPDNYSFIIVRT